MHCTPHDLHCARVSRGGECVGERGRERVTERQLFRVVCRSLQCFVQVASASMDAQAVLDEAHVEEEEDVNDVPEYM